MEVDKRKKKTKLSFKLRRALIHYVVKTRSALSARFRKKVDKGATSNSASANSSSVVQSSQLEPARFDKGVDKGATSNSATANSSAIVQRSQIERLPREIKHLIFDKMHCPASATALGITCKAWYEMYRVYFHSPRTLEQSQQAVFWDAAWGFIRRVRLDVYTRSLEYMPLHQLIRDFFPKDLVYWNGGYNDSPKFVTQERLEELLKEQAKEWELVPSWINM